MVVLEPRMQQSLRGFSGNITTEIVFETTHMCTAKFIVLVINVILTYVILSYVLEYINDEIVRYKFRQTKIDEWVNNNRTQTSQLDTNNARWMLRLSRHDGLFHSEVPVSLTFNNKCNTITGRLVNFQGEFNIDGRQYGDVIVLTLTGAGRTINTQLVANDPNSLSGSWFIRDSSPFKHGDIHIYNRQLI